MSDQQTSGQPSQAGAETLEIELRDPRLAAFLAWLIPGSGHLYQGRTGKGILFMACILSTFFFGLYLGDGRVVYASMRSEDRRLPYLCQIGVGLPALPALVQANRMRNQSRPKAPLWNGFMAPPRMVHQVVPSGSIDPADAQRLPQTDAYVVNMRDEQHDWIEELHGYFELGTVYTMIAGLLNVLAIYDAWGGPLLIVEEKDESEPDGASDSS